MRMYDIIHKKRDGRVLSPQEIQFWIEGVVNGTVPDYQSSALLMAIYYQGMTDDEAGELTVAMANSGEQVDLSAIDGIKVDKHSTGGVGDKTTMIIAPMAAACGVSIAKMSGRGLGHTGGTIDKLESIPGFKTDLSREQFIENVKRIGAAVVSQSGNLCPADKKLYALRDVTATVESIPLIAASVMSKKIASGADRILLDVKKGSGAFVKTAEQAEKLASIMKSIGEKAGRKTEAMITDMDNPLGYCIGNALEIIEVCETLQGKGPKDLTDLCVELAAHMIYLGERASSLEEGREKAKSSITNGSAFAKLKEIVSAQGGDVSYIEDNSLFPLSAIHYEMKSIQSGEIQSIDAEACGIAAMTLGAGRETKTSEIDYGAGIILCRKKGEHVEAGEVLAKFYSESKEKCLAAEKILQQAFKIKIN
ncbi:pyrimidine-nucleoside phosphorylase [Scatolibacter rhodanostii]|uniref:pyrimidine-nucleoside phosphorylase n=1 Tax=Scatolibacter rhodanostii TaxID=2014781 RepID=UPI000C07C134|nr:pyrimidine-nucleoside phosphorylase [Scatolibacter rhodanostii]